MKLLTYKYHDKEVLGILTSDGKQVLPLEELGFSFSSMNDLIDQCSEEQMTQIKLAAENTSIPSVPYDSVTKCAPIPVPKQDIICLGINYAAHAEESARYKKEAFERNREYAVYFSAIPTSWNVSIMRRSWPLLLAKTRKRFLRKMLLTMCSVTQS